MTVCIGFSTTPWPVSWLIRLITRSKESHCWLYVEDATGRWVYQAAFGGYIKTDWAAFQKSAEVVKVVQPRQPLSQGVALAQSWVGTERYDFDALVGGLWVELGRALKKKLHNPFFSPRETICSEAIMRILIASNYPGATRLLPQDSTPQDVDDLLQGEPVVTLRP